MLTGNAVVGYLGDGSRFNLIFHKARCARRVRGGQLGGQVKREWARGEGEMAHGLFMMPGSLHRRNSTSRESYLQAGHLQSLEEESFS